MWGIFGGISLIMDHVDLNEGFELRNPGSPDGLIELKKVIRIEERDQAVSKRLQVVAIQVIPTALPGIGHPFGCKNSLLFIFKFKSQDRLITGIPI